MGVGVGVGVGVEDGEVSEVAFRTTRGTRRFSLFGGGVSSSLKLDLDLLPVTDLDHGDGSLKPHSSTSSVGVAAHLLSMLLPTVSEVVAVVAVVVVVVVLLPLRTTSASRTIGSSPSIAHRTSWRKEKKEEEQGSEKKRTKIFFIRVVFAK